jgi:predicted lipoprotein with Yx(FWY)xxD motif
MTLQTTRRTAPPGRADHSGSSRRTGHITLRGLGAASAVALLASMVFSAPFAAASSATVDVTTNATFGLILTNALGFTLYTFPSDHNGISSCTGSCAVVWPPLTVPSGTTPVGGPGVTGTVSAVLQPGGADQVTYNGSPLYTFIGDSSPGQVVGNNVDGFKVAMMSTGVGISSGPSASATVGAPFSFTVTTTGTPPPTIKAKGKLPKGVKFNRGIGTAMISGTPTSTKHKSATGTYHLTITATFGTGKTKQLATQSFTLTVT